MKNNQQNHIVTSLYLIQGGVKIQVYVELIWQRVYDIIRFLAMAT